ncbi:dTDP-4-amino-4,6-dideoxygalactose transaminase [Polynucleobacter paneuropaeus]|nr:dTDP-4-amino-4,6-dideoxygalactose transaminase [Polynucleobacter paneuropaeus]
MKTKDNRIPFNLPYMTGNELSYISQAHSNGILAGDGPFTKRCQSWLESRSGCNKSLLTHSCTGALEMAALLLDIKPGDEVIMPSYTFVSTANAFVLRGGIPVFVDIREDTLNLNEKLIQSAITSRSRAIVPVHYAGVACEMDGIMAIARQHGLTVVEDAAQGVMSKYKGRDLGGIGDLGAYSFHETKNVTCGEGGALIINAPHLALRAEIIREKGTDRGRFFRGEVDKYTWQEMGSSFLPGELNAAFLWAQLEQADRITRERLISWHHYHKMLKSFENLGLLRRPIIPEECEHNAHMYYIILNSHIDRDQVISSLKKNNIYSMFHYVPLHTSLGGKLYGRAHGDLGVTLRQSENLLRLPLWVGINFEQQNRVIEVLSSALQ